MKKQIIRKIAGGTEKGSKRKGSVLDFDILVITPPLPLEKVSVNPHRLDAARIVRFRAVAQVADEIYLQRFIRHSLQRHSV
jgi:hypothetical protein